MAKKSFKQWRVTGSDLAAGTNTKGVKIAGNKADKFKGIKVSGNAPLKNDKGPVKDKPNKVAPLKNDKFLGPKNPKQQASQAKAEKAVDKNKKLMKSFDGPRTVKGADGKVRPTKAWAAYLKKNGSEVVAKSRLGKPDHITQMTNAWVEKHAQKPTGKHFKGDGHKH